MKPGDTVDLVLGEPSYPPFHARAQVASDNGESITVRLGEGILLTELDQFTKITVLRYEGREAHRNEATILEIRAPQGQMAAEVDLKMIADAFVVANRRRFPRLELQLPLHFRPVLAGSIFEVDPTLGYGEEEEDSSTSPESYDAGLSRLSYGGRTADLSLGGFSASCDSPGPLARADVVAARIIAGDESRICLARVAWSAASQNGLQFGCQFVEASREFSTWLEGVLSRHT